MIRLRIAAALLLAIPWIALAHQPRITESRMTVVQEPEISKAYYGTLKGEPDIYTIQSDAPFELFVQVLVPDAPGQKKDVSAVVLKNDDQVALLEGSGFAWERMYEPFGADWYWEGPRYKARVDGGTYEIRVWSSNNDSKYSLAVGEIEAFDVTETLNALRIIPMLKKDFFLSSPLTFLKSPFGIGLVLAMYALAFVFGFLYRFLLKRFRAVAVRNSAKNIGRTDRFARFAIALALLGWAVMTTWSPILLFFSGLALFEAVFSWCALYAAIGKNTCPA